MDWTRSDERLAIGGLSLLLALGCSDDGIGDDGTTSVAADTSATAGSTSAGNTGTTGNTTSSASTGDPPTSSTDGASTDGDTTAGATTTGCEETVAPEDGMEVASCEACSPEQLCMELTEHGGPADGGGPMVTLYCFPFPVCCEAEADCDCAGHLCPEGGGGVESMCQVGGGILQCDVAFP